MKMTLQGKSKSTLTSMIIVAVLAAVMLVSTSASTSYYDVDCYQSEGPVVNSSSPSLVSSTTCSTTGYTMLFCGIGGSMSTKNITGSYIENDICYVGLDSDSDGWVKARARCCALPSGSSCSSVKRQETSADSVTMDCSSSADDVLVSCSINEDYNSSNQQFEGVYAGADYSSTDTRTSDITNCTGSSFDVSSNPFTTGARCCSTSADYQMECYSEWSYETTGYSTDTCDTDYFMTGCVAINNYATSMQAYSVNTGDTCYTRNANQDEQYIQRTCCRITEFTPSPTPDPTPSPTTVLEGCYARCSLTSSGSGSAVVAPMPVTPVLGSLIEFGEISMIVTDFQAVVFTVGIVAVIMSCLSACACVVTKLCANNKYAGVGRYEIFEKENENQIGNEDEDDTELVN